MPSVSAVVTHVDTGHEAHTHRLASKKPEKGTRDDSGHLHADVRSWQQRVIRWVRKDMKREGRSVPIGTNPTEPVQPRLHGYSVRSMI